MQRIADDLEKYIDKRKEKSKYLVENFEERYETFKIGILLKKAREEAGLTQDEVAKKLDLPLEKIHELIDSGQAHAALHAEV